MWARICGGWRNFLAIDIRHRWKQLTVWMLTCSRSCVHTRESLKLNCWTLKHKPATCLLQLTQPGKAEAAGLNPPGDVTQNHHQEDWSHIVLLHLTIKIRKTKGLGVGKRCAEKIGSWKVVLERREPGKKLETVVGGKIVEVKEIRGDRCWGMPWDLGQWHLRWVTASSGTAGTRTSLPGSGDPGNIHAGTWDSQVGWKLWSCWFCHNTLYSNPVWGVCFVLPAPKSLVST